MARGFGRQRRNAISITTQLTLQALGNLLYMTKGRPSSVLIQLILQQWLTSLRLLGLPQTGPNKSGSASEVCPHCGCLVAVARSCRSSWHWAENRKPGKFERAARGLPEELIEPVLLVNDRDFELLRNEYERLFNERYKEGVIEKKLFITSTPDVPNDEDSWAVYQRAARNADFLYRWRYND